MLVIDTNTDCTGKGAYLKSQGVTTVGRYYGVAATYRAILSFNEASELTDNGMSIFVVFEKTGNAADLTLTQAAGASDAVGLRVRPRARRIAVNAASRKLNCEVLSARLRRHQQRIAGVSKSGAGVRFTGQRHELLGELV